MTVLGCAAVAATNATVMVATLTITATLQRLPFMLIFITVPASES